MPEPRTARHTPGPCACRYESYANRICGTSISIPVGHIIYCPTHAAAPELVDHLRAFAEATPGRWDEVLAREDARALLRRIEGE